MVVQLGHGPDGGARGPHRAVLVNGNSRQNAVNTLDLGLVHAVEKLPRIGREALDIAPLAFSVQDIESQTRLARPTDPGHHRQLAQGNLHIDVFEIVLARASYPNRVATRPVGFQSCPPRMGISGQVERWGPPLDLTVSPSY